MMFNKNALSRAVATVLMGASVASVFVSTPSTAANNTLSNISAVETIDEKKVQYVDLTLNVDWDYDNPDDPKYVQLGTGNNPSATGKPAVNLDRKYIEELIRQTGRTLFVMTNGQHRLGKVFVFKNGKFGTNVDIRVLNTPGRANADAAGWRADGGLTTNNYITNCTLESPADGECPGNPATVLDPENFVQTGEVIAHELGHYLYGLYDEYVDPKACNAEQPQSPCKTDKDRPTAMNNQAASYRLSTAEDYPLKDFANTAHGRVYGQSTWETLISSPEADSEVAKNTHNGRRIQFDAFKEVPTPPAISSLIAFVGKSGTDADGNSLNTREDRLSRQTGEGAEVSKFTGYDQKLSVVFDDTPASEPAAQSEPAARIVSASMAPAAIPAAPRNVIMIDRTVPESTFKDMIAAAKGLVDRAPANARFALLAFPNGTPSGFMAMDAAGKTSLKDQLGGLTRISSQVDLAVIYNSGASLVKGARPSTGTESAANTDTFSLYTLNTTAVPTGLGDKARNDKIAFNVIGFKAATPVADPASANSLATLAKDSGGSNNTVKSVNDAIKKADQALGDTIGETEALIASDLSDDALVAGEAFESRFQVGGDKVDGPVVVRWYFSSADMGKLVFQCVAPNGVTATVTPVVIEALSDDESVASCTIQKGAGAWIARATASAPSGGVEVEVVSTLKGAPVEVSASIEGGTKDDNRKPMLLVKMSGQFPITGAKITADIFNADSASETPVKTIVLDKSNDMGINGDSRANDGIYTASLVNQLPAGSYFAAVSAVTTAESKFNPVQIFQSSTTNAPGAFSVGAPIERTAETEFDLESGAAGVGLVAGSCGSGGCTVGGGSDAGLMALLSLSLLGLMRRRFKVKNQTPRA